MHQRQNKDFEWFWKEHDLPITLKKDWVWANGSDAYAPAPTPTTSEDIGEAGWKAFEALKIEWYPSQDRLIILNRRYFTETMVSKDIRGQSRTQGWMKDGDVIKKAKIEYQDSVCGINGLVLVNKAFIDGLQKAGTEGKGLQALSADGSRAP